MPAIWRPVLARVSWGDVFFSAVCAWQHLSKLKAVAKTNKLDEEEEDGDEENYFHSSFPTTNRKGIGPGLSAGDPVLNKLNKYKMAPKACILTGNCVEVPNKVLVPAPSALHHMTSVVLHD